jgi:hypothetical protein
MMPPPIKEATVMGSPNTKNATTIAMSGSMYKNTPVPAVERA